jgi:hypothetical protein
MSNKLAQEVESLLTGALGEFIAKATVKKNCELIGVTPDTLTAAQLPELAEKIDKSVSFFSGDDVGSEVAAKIKAMRV